MLDKTELGLRATGQESDRPLADILGAVRKIRGEDIPDSGSSPVELLPFEQKKERWLLDSIAKYRSNPHTPELVTKTWDVIWNVWSGRVGLGIGASHFPASQEDLTKHERQGDKAIYIPDFFATERGQFFLTWIFPKMRNFTFLDGKSIQNDFSRPVTHTGWRYVEASVDAPHRNTTADELRELFVSGGRQGMTHYEYVIAAQESRLTTGQYFDSRNNILSRLLGANHQGGHYLRAWFDGSTGQFNTFLDVNPNKKDPKYGGRSSQIIR